MGDPRPSIRSDKANDNFEKTHFCMLEFMSHREVCPTKTVVGRGRDSSAPLCEIDDGDMRRAALYRHAPHVTKKDTPQDIILSRQCVPLHSQPNPDFIYTATC